jgi:DNA-binding GntR family transcriptional regulator
MRRAAQIGDRLALCQADLWFHDRIIALAASPMLEATWRLLARGVLVFLMREHGGTASSLSLWIAEHEELLAILESDSSAVLDEHIEHHIFSGVSARRLPYDPAISLPGIA